MKRDIDSSLAEYNRQIIGPADKIVRQGFGQVIDDGIFDYPDNYNNLQQTLTLEASIVDSFSKLRQRPLGFSDLTIEARTTTEGFKRTFSVNMANAWSRRLDPALAQALTEVDTEGIGGASPYRLSFTINHSRDSKPQGSDLTLHGSALTALPSGMDYEAILFFQAHPEEAWKAQTTYLYSEQGFLKATRLPFKTNQSLPGTIDDSEIDLRTRNIALNSGVEWKRVVTPVTTADLPIIKAGYIIASRLLQAEQQIR